MGAQEQLPVRPAGVHGTAASAPISWESRWRASVTAWFAKETMWNASTETAVRGSHMRRALRNAADGSIATTSTPSRHASGRAKSQSPTPVLSRPSTMPSTRPVSRSTIVVIHGSTRTHGDPSASRYQRTDR